MCDESCFVMAWGKPRVSVSSVFLSVFVCVCGRARVLKTADVLLVAKPAPLSLLLAGARRQRSW